MRITIDEKEYVVKSRQAIEILDLVEKTGLLKKAQEMSKTEMNESNMLQLLEMVPVGYKTAHKIMAIVTGTVKDGKVIPNDNVADELEAMKLPLLAINVVKTLILPISYVMTSDSAMEEEKKSDTVESEDIKVGTKESKTEPEA